MRKITLHGATLDKHGKYRDAGDVLTVGAADNDDADIATAEADRLIEDGRAVTMTDAIAEAAAAAGKPIIDPLDHDGDGRKGGMKGVPAKGSSDK